MPTTSIKVRHPDFGYPKEFDLWVSEIEHRALSVVCFRLFAFSGSYGISHPVTLSCGTTHYPPIAKQRARRSAHRAPLPLLVRKGCGYTRLHNDDSMVYCGVCTSNGAHWANHCNACGRIVGRFWFWSGELLERAHAGRMRVQGNLVGGSSFPLKHALCVLLNVQCISCCLSLHSRDHLRMMRIVTT